MRVLRAILLLALAFPAAARAGEVSLGASSVPVAGGRSLASLSPPQRFNMLGVHWRGSGTVEFRTHRIHGAWSTWQAADADTGPDARSPEGAAGSGRHDGNLVWAGGSDRAQFRFRGPVSSVRAFYLWSRVGAAAPRALQSAGAPAIVTRQGWQADEKIRRAKPLYASSIRFALVHHTAGSNSYTPQQSAAIVRGIETYHVKSNGWNDIGYNFLVDKYGQVFEGRYGGMERNVVGAHSAGFNTGSVGVALIGNNSSTAITAAQRAALVQLLAWRLDVAHTDPAGSVSVVSGGNGKYRAGTRVTLRVVSGHRDTYLTDCPGDAAYRQLGSIASEVAATGLPKLYAPSVTGALGRAVRFSGRLSAPLSWSVSVVDAAGQPVGRGSGSGTAVDWTWTAPSTGGPFRWTIDAPGIRVATGTLGGALPAPPVTLLSGVKATPQVVTPGADGIVPSQHVELTLAQPALVTVTVLDAGGLVARTLMAEPRPAGQTALDWPVADLADGRYKLVVTAQPAAGQPASAVLDVAVDRTVAGFTATPLVVSPNGDGANDTITFSFTLAASVPARLEIRDAAGAVLATPLQGTLEPGPHVVDWNGLSATGLSVPDGQYQGVLVVTDALGEVAVPLPFTIDLTPPLLRILDARKLRFSLSEPATVTLLVNHRRVVKVAPKGVFSVPRSVPVTSVSGLAVDVAGNAGPVVRTVVKPKPRAKPKPKRRS